MEELRFVNEIIWERKRAQAWETNKFGITLMILFFFTQKAKTVFLTLFTQKMMKILRNILKKDSDT